MAKPNKIKLLRKERDITLEELAERTGISVSHLSRMEAGTRGLSLENAILISRGLGVQVSEVDESFASVLPASDEQIASLDHELIQVFPTLSEESRKDVLNLAKRLKALEERASSR